MEVKVEQMIKLKFGDAEVNVSREDAEKLYDQLSDVLGYEDISIPHAPSPRYWSESHTTNTPMPWNTFERSTGTVITAKTNLTKKE